MYVLTPHACYTIQPDANYDHALTVFERGVKDYDGLENTQR